MFNGKIHYKSPFSIAILNYQRVSMYTYNGNIDEVVWVNTRNEILIGCQLHLLKVSLLVVYVYVTLLKNKGMVGNCHNYD